MLLIAHVFPPACGIPVKKAASMSFKTDANSRKETGNSCFQGVKSMDNPSYMISKVADHPQCKQAFYLNGARKLVVR
jgi:hypothetical protein